MKNLKESNINKKDEKRTIVGAGVALGVGVGLAIGNSIGNVGAGLAIGLALGVGFITVQLNSDKPDD